MPTEPQLDTDPQRYLLSTVRQSQAAVIDIIRSWTTITEQLTRSFRLPAPDVAGSVDRAFDLAEETLAAQHRLARTLAGVATRRIDVVEDLIEAAETAQQRVQELQQPPEALTVGDPPTVESSRQDRRPDGRTYEERSVEELRGRAGELQIEGRSSMSKDELIAALRDHRQRRSAKMEHRPDRRIYEERSIEELRERARELEIEGRSTMSKDQLVDVLRRHAR